MFEGGRLEGQPLTTLPGNGFVAGFAARHDAAATALRHAFSERPRGFAPADLIARIDAARPEEAGPKHFSPADRATNPTEGWDPLRAAVDTPHLDPVELARAEGYAEGLAAARAAVDEAAERDKALLAELLDRIHAGDRIDREAVARRLRQTVLLLVGKLVGEIGVSADLLAGRIETAADLLSDANESAMLRVHPDDVALLDGRLPATIFPVGDASIARGSFVLEAASTIVEDGPALWLEQLEGAMDRLAVPR
jgi:flagellar assembly protein FliH